MTATVHVCYAFATELEHLSALGARGDFNVGLAFKCRDVDLTAQCRNGKRDWHLAIQIVGFAMEDVVLLDVDHDIKISGCSPADARLAVSGRTQSSALPDSRRNLQFDSAWLFNTRFAAAFLAWLFDDFTGAVATWTCLRDMKEATGTDHLSAPTTGRTTCLARPRFGTAAMALVARIKLLNFNRLLCAES